ncbi:TVP38/TMEM64 family protein [Natronolimnohabitans innermongolicus]|uniref:VTT domain-containing protein n=1 Tax=Natronolimnohabitans innermongolicus JCM 12255 TaxID=1227499 RepID=L9X773_9EURY|nr:VTT domain-containing protein [Natronolimnohabitans innermongolicus]ELY57629.1 hypothetical protein C493_09116 [Natronolimnohabitans innermongolicus JCM 12255]
MSLPSARTRALLAVTVIGAILAAGALISPSSLLGRLEATAADPALFALVVAGLYLARPLFALPTTPLAVVVGYGFGVALGVPIALLGVVVTVIPVFLAARWIAGAEPQPTAERDPGATSRASSSASAASTPRTSLGPLDTVLEQASDAVDRYYETAGPTRGVVASRLAPIPSDVSTCAAATASGVRLRHLVLGTAIGELPWTVAGVVVGASAATIRTDGLGDLGFALTAACLFAAAVLLAGPAYRLVRTRRGARAGGQMTDR